MRVYGPSNIPGYGQGPGEANRSNKDGQRRHGQQGKDEGKKPHEEHDEVELHAPAESEGVKKVMPPSTPVKPKGDKEPPLDLSA